MIASLVALSACGTQPSRPNLSIAPAPQPVQEVKRAEITLLLPLSGPQAGIGNAILNGAQLALIEQGTPGYEFVPRDTNGTAGGATAAAREALSAGSKLMVGPLTAPEATAISPVARAGQVPVLAFTNDSTVAQPGIWVLGVTPTQQVRRVVGAAVAGGAKTIGIAGPDNAFTQRLASELRNIASSQGLPSPIVVTYPGMASPILAARDLSQKIADAKLDALLIAESGPRARDFASALAAAGVQIPPLKLMGTMLWAGDNTLGGEPALRGATFPAPDPMTRQGFEERYQATFGERAPRFAAMGYDAALLAMRAIQGQGPMAMATVPVGDTVIGAEGVIRLLPSGQAQRALAVFAIAPSGEPTVVEPAALPMGPGT
ncbi:penicillin-binding protein activator [Acetobacteraceae bacterium H6797]|nr:penicillin-binding protein activator [Acetobacteraceae bacterium H6797]